MGNHYQVYWATAQSRKTLILEGTQIKDEYLGTADWENTKIIELNVLSCYRLSFSGLSAVLPKLKRLRYLKCAMTDEILRLIMDGFPLLQVFFLQRRYPVTVQSVSDLLFHCPSVTCLDISSIPLAFVYFETFLPRMPRLQLLSFARNELLGTENIRSQKKKKEIALTYKWYVLIIFTRQTTSKSSAPLYFCFKDAVSSRKLF